MKLRSSGAGVLFGTFLAALTLSVAAPGSAYAAACAGSGCDGHDPNIQTWQSGPVTTYYEDLGNSTYIELRWGKTDGDQYSWGRIGYVGLVPSSPSYRITVERCNSAGTSCTTNLGSTAAGASAWTAKIDTNSYVTRTPMYYNPSTSKMRACAIPSSGSKVCTPYY
ncbi:hypothetical protein [Streptomyces sp. NPDC093109]|uniref:hypothetical protein n=1 Tax=Streptomyces sp. NPDC093109 TaxID=3154977 RepID=UPI00344B77E7